eukprot:TRINITY_DN8351_c0_g1_i2.p1 TRINITY_DN8351_c0_g1~~TRINITY_DN8351_c0_g1_i2.p1  ORF type:complete len:529 (-),score=19.31 TRINITY_DN8351_c0_g1_i2:271-1800(-)
MEHEILRLASLKYIDARFENDLLHSRSVALARFNVFMMIALDIAILVFVYLAFGNEHLLRCGIGLFALTSAMCWRCWCRRSQLTSRCLEALALSLCVVGLCLVMAFRLLIIFRTNNTPCRETKDTLTFAVWFYLLFVLMHSAAPIRWCMVVMLDVCVAIIGIILMVLNTGEAKLELYTLFPLWLTLLLMIWWKYTSERTERHMRYDHAKQASLHHLAVLCLETFCDSWVLLDSRFNVVKSCYRAAATLVGHIHSTLQGRRFDDFIPTAAERDRFKGELQNSDDHSEHLPVRVFPITLQDSHGLVFNARCHCAMFNVSHGEYSYLIGIDEQGERGEPSGEAHAQIDDSGERIVPATSAHAPACLGRMSTAEEFEESTSSVELEPLNATRFDEVAVTISDGCPFAIQHCSSKFLRIFGPLSDQTSFDDLLENLEDFGLWIQRIGNAVTTRTQVRLRSNESGLPATCMADVRLHSLHLQRDNSVHVRLELHHVKQVKQRKQRAKQGSPRVSL